MSSRAGPPVQIPPLSLRVVFGPWSQLNWAPSAWWRDLPPAFKISQVRTQDRASLNVFKSLLEPRLDAAPGSRIHQPQAAAFVPFTGAELRQAQPGSVPTLFDRPQEFARARECVGIFISYVVGMTACMHKMPSGMARIACVQYYACMYVCACEPGAEPAAL